MISIGTMSGTSCDGIDVSLIDSDGEQRVKILNNFYLKYSEDFKEKFFKLRKKILNVKDLENNKILINSFSREVTLKHIEAIKQILQISNNLNVNIIGFHGVTLLHDPKKKISFQLGVPELLSQNFNTDVIFNFRDNDILHGGEGAPLATVFHEYILKNLKRENDSVIINIGGIANGSYILNSILYSNDIGPGNCLLDEWVRQNSKKEMDIDGSISCKGECNKVIFEDFLNHYQYHSTNTSLDINDFNISQFRGLTLEDGAKTLVCITAELILDFLKKLDKEKKTVILCGGGRKNKTLINYLKEKSKLTIEIIEKYDFDGDFIESQAFAFLAIRSLKNKFLSYPTTTGVSKPSSGGKLYKAS